MQNKGADKGVIKTVIAAEVSFACCIAARIFLPDPWGDAVSSAGFLIAFAILMRSFSLTSADGGRALTRRYVFLAFAFAAACRSLADLLRAAGLRQQESAFPGTRPVLVLFAASGVFLLAGLILYLPKRVRSWGLLQIIADAAAISSACFLLIWIIFLEREQGNIIPKAADSWYPPLSLFIDTALVVAVAVWLIAARHTRTHAGLVIAALSVMLYAAADAARLYYIYKDLAAPDAVLEALPLLAFLSAAAGAGMVPSTWLMTEKRRRVVTPGEYTRRGLLLLPLPLVVIAYEGFDVPDLFVCGLLILSHNVITHFIHESAVNEHLLRREKAITLNLEKRIAERTNELIAKTEQLDFLANRDTVTNLYNRRYFLEELGTMFLSLEEDDTLALATLDLDRFKTINDMYGHYIGDNIIIELAKRLQFFEKNHTMIARFGGDEFVIAIRGKNSLEDIEKLLRRVIAKCSEPIHIRKNVFEVTMSVGISVYPIDADNTDMLLRNSEMAMFQAKKEGYNQIVVFSDILKENMRWKNKIEINLRKADFNREFRLYYQPQFSIPDRKLVGMEALLRWNCAGRGFVNPSVFIPIAEEINWIVPIGDWVLNQAVSQAVRWNRQYGTDLKIAVNVSPKQLDVPDFTRHVLSVLSRREAPPEWIDLEITEGVAMEGSSKIESIASQFRESGITVSIDDFGTGYSSLSYLKLFPFQRVKIAHELIDNITFDRYDLQIVRSILLLAESIGVDCIAEGIETQEQFDLLQGLGCRQMQGYLLGKPMPAEEFEKTLLQPGRTLQPAIH